MWYYTYDVIRYGYGYDMIIVGGGREGMWYNMTWFDGTRLLVALPYRWLFDRGTRIPLDGATFLLLLVTKYGIEGGGGIVCCFPSCCHLIIGHAYSPFETEHNIVALLLISLEFGGGISCAASHPVAISSLTTQGGGYRCVVI